MRLEGESRVAEPCFLGRQPILDRRQQIVAYELLFRGSAFGPAQIESHTEATATVLLRALSDLGVESALENKRAFVNFDAGLLHSEAIELLDPERFVIEVLEHVQPTPEVVARCRELRGVGFTLALDDYVEHTERFEEMLSVAHIVKVDLLPLADAALAQLVAALRPYPVKLLAEKVDSRERFERCRELGFEYFQGYHFARPTIVSGRKLDQSEMALIRLLGLLLADADGSQIEGHLKHEPGLAVGLLRLANSPGIGLGRPVGSLREAIFAVGLKPMQRWVQLLIFAHAGGDAGAGARLQWAAARARFIELLAGSAGSVLPEQAFLAGILSFLPDALGLPLAEVLRLIPVAPEVAAALQNREGALGQMMRLAIQLDQTEVVENAPRWDLPAGLDAQEINRLHGQALAWAAEASKALA